MSTTDKVSTTAGNGVRVFPVFTMGLIARFATDAGTNWQGVSAHDAGNIMIVTSVLGLLFLTFLVALVGALAGAVALSRR